VTGIAWGCTSKAEGDASDADASVLWHMSLDLLYEGVSKRSTSTAICIEKPSLRHAMAFKYEMWEPSVVPCKFC
jgi:hypothetical protein